MEKDTEEWFRNWFDSPYYHLLYKHRDEDEARSFLDHLLANLHLPENADLLDIPCGRGRHAIYLESKGFRVRGMDLSPANIRVAEAFASKNLQFYVHDMRQHIGSNMYHGIFNLFTSLGYFKWAHENLMVLKNMVAALKTDGYLVIDFFNAEKLSNDFQPQTTREVDGITFHIQRRKKGQRMIKDIRFTANNRNFHYEENVLMISKAQFESLFAAANLHIDAVYGSYDLQTFMPESSERLIFILRKK